MIAATLRLFPYQSSVLTAFSSFPPKSSSSNRQLCSALHDQCFRFRIKNHRRDIALLSFLALVPPLSLTRPAAAFDIGISGPKEWLAEQKKKSSKFLLAPIDASRESLRVAYLLLTSDSGFSAKELEEVQKLLGSAARDCVPQDRNVFVQFQAKTGVEVCTFRLIVKNASSLLGKNDPVKLKAEAMLDDLIRSFTSLTVLASETDAELASNRQGVVDALMTTMSCLDRFEQGIKECLGI